LYELCGGTHARATGQIGMIKITGESSVAAGTRRIEAVTGLGALQLLRRQTDIVDRLAREVKARPEEVIEKVMGTLEKLKAAEKAREQMLLQDVNKNVQEMIEKDAQLISGVRCIIKKIDAGAFPRSTHQAMLDSLVGKLNNGVAVLTQIEDGTLSVIAAVGEQARAKVKAGDLIKELSTVAGGKGGGRPDRAQAGSKFPEKETAVLEEARRLCTRLLGQ